MQVYLSVCGRRCDERHRRFSKNTKETGMKSNEVRSIEQHPLRPLFRPKSVVLYGASDKSMWSQLIAGNFAAYGFEGKLFAVNKRGVPAHGIPGFTSCREIGEPVDSAYFFVPVEGILEAVEDAAAAGVKSGVVLTSGFSETGANGAELERKVVELAEKYGMKLLGPNSLGFANFAENAALTVVSPPVLPMVRGGVALLSQSGAGLGEIAAFAMNENVGLSFMAAMGNQAQVGLAEMMDYLVDDPNTRVIAVFAESITDTAVFAAAAERAMAAAKPVVVMKVGKSSLSGAVAAAHTGSLVGDDRVFDAACQRYGVIRTNSVEELVLTAGIAAQVGPLKKLGIGVLSISGGACGMIADMAEEFGVPLPPFAPETVAALREIVAGYGTTINPMDITGAAVRDPDLWERELKILDNDPSLGLILAQTSLPGGLDAPGIEQVRPIGRALSVAKTPGLLLVQSIKPVTQGMRDVLKETGIPGVAVGIEHTMRALGKLVWWSRLLQKRQGEAAAVATRASAQSTARPTSERQVLDYLEGFGVPVIPAQVARSADEAVAAARGMEGKVVLKIASPDINHKTEVGGVKLGLQGDEAVARAYLDIDASVRAACPDARIDGVIVSPMRSGGVELIVGTARDPQWGPVIVVGLGGVWVEVLKDTALQLLPVSRSDVVDMLNSLRAVKLLQGFRGAAPVNLDAVADAVVRIGDAALSLGDDMAALEVNPLLAFGDRVEALDGVVIWDHPAAP